MFRRYLDSALNLVLPARCYHCQRLTTPDYPFLCLSCLLGLKIYDPGRDLNSVLSTRLAGKIRTKTITTLYWYQKNTPIQTVLHTLKYQFRPAIGLWLGRLLGERLSQSGLEGPVYLIPVPIHPLKKIERGYNQAELIARGIQQTLTGTILLESAVEKKTQRTSQTRLNRLSRWKNKQQDMELKSIDSLAKLENAHFLIVDDIITTGATIGQVGKMVSEAHPSARLSVATIALTE